MADISFDVTLAYRSTVPSPTVQVLNGQPSAGSYGNSYNDLLLTLPYSLFTTGLLKSMSLLSINASTKHTILHNEMCALWVNRDGKRLYSRTLSKQLGYRTALHWITEWQDLTPHGMFVVPGDVVQIACMPASGGSDTGGSYVIDMSIIVLEEASAA